MLLMEEARLLKTLKMFKSYEFFLVLFCISFVLFGLILIGANPIGAVFFLLCITGQTMLGMILWLKASQKWSPDFLQLLAVGIPIGMILSTLFAQIFLFIGFGTVGFCLAAVIGIGGWFSKSFRFRKVTFTDISYTVKVFLYGVLISQPLLWIYVKTNPQKTNEVLNYQIDIPYLAALTHAVTTWGGSVNPVYSGEPLRYHWLVYGWAGWESKILNLSELQVLARVLPVIGILGLIIGILASTRLFTENRYSPILALTLVFIAIPVGTTNFIGSMRLSSPSQYISYSWVLAALIIYMSYLKNQTDSSFALVCLTTLFLGIAGGKITSSAIFVGATFGVALVHYHRQNSRKAAYAFLLVMFTTALVFLTMMFTNKVDSATGITFSPGLSWFSGISVEQIQSYSFVRQFVFWGSVSLAGYMGIIIKVSGLITLIGVRRNLRTEEIFVISSLTTGAILTGFLSQKGHSQLYFIQTALVVAAPIVAATFFRARDLLFFSSRFYEPRLVVTGVILSFLVFYGHTNNFFFSSIASVPITMIHVVVPFLVFATAFWLTIMFVSSTKLKSPKVQSKALVLYSLALTLMVASIFTGALYQVRDRNLLESAYEPGIVSYEQSGGWTQAHEDALTWLKVRTNLDDIIATNRFCVSGDPIDSCFAPSYVVSALVERQVFIEGHYWYATSTQDRKPPRLMNRIEASLAFSKSPSEISWNDLRLYGVTWLVIDKKFPKAKTWEPYGRIEYENEYIILVQLNTSSTLTLLN